MTAAVQWTETPGRYVTHVRGCTLTVALTSIMGPDWPGAWEWWVVLGSLDVDCHGSAIVGHYPGRSLADAQQAALERAQAEAVAAARDLAERSGLVAALARIEQLEALLGAVAQDLHTLLTRPMGADTTERVLRGALERTRRAVLADAPQPEADGGR